MPRPTASISKVLLAEVGEIKREVEIGGAQELHNGLEIVFASACNAHSVALDLGFGFGKFVADEFGDAFGFVLVETLFEGHFLGRFEVAFDNLARGVE